MTASWRFAGDLVQCLVSTRFGDCSGTVVGYGNMGRHYVKALRALGVGKIFVCSRSENVLRDLDAIENVTSVPGGFQELYYNPSGDELGIIATPTDRLVAAAKHLVSLGFRNLLIEKPVSLFSSEIEALASTFGKAKVTVKSAYNRLAYPSFIELSARAEAEGGITSVAYGFTEMVRGDWDERFPKAELARWGIANSLHVIGMAHGLMGPASQWTGYRAGALPWHSTGSSFVLAGLSEKNIPFSAHADWSSKGRWFVEVNTAVSSYRLCPLEKLFRKTAGTGEWEEVPLRIFAPEVKMGLAEEIAAMLNPACGEFVKLPTLWETAALTRFAERLFGYDHSQDSANVP